MTKPDQPADDTDCEPRVHDGVPLCTGDACRHHDGKRCGLLGYQPGAICEPEVAADLVRLGEANAKLDSMRERLTEQVKVAEWFHAAALTIDGLSAEWERRMRYCRQVADSEPENAYPPSAAYEEAVALGERLEAAHAIREALHALPGWGGDEDDAAIGAVTGGRDEG